MKTSIKVFLIIGLVLFIGGAAICGAGLACHREVFSGGSFGWTPQKDRLEQLDQIVKSFDADAVLGLNVNEVEGKVVLIPGEGDEVIVTYYDSESLRHEVSLSASGVLTVTVKQQRQRNWLWRIANLQWMNFGYDATLTIEVPQDLSRDVKISTASADVEVNGLTIGGDLRVETASGNVKVWENTLSGSLTLSSVSGDVQALTMGKVATGKLESMSGDLTVRDTGFGSLTLSSVSGDIKLSNAAAGGQVTCDTMSGNVRINGLNAQTLHVSSISGDIDLVGVTAPVQTVFDTMSG
ncbi:MAG: DUF4097 domain-containing protein, partial [Clostridiales bacterium]|nr:DUF4097 domain-containing protein [Clostridiales bacterium]